MSVAYLVAASIRSRGSYMRLAREEGSQRKESVLAKAREAWRNGLTEMGNDFLWIPNWAARA